jgi:two-component system, sensor histidine kinase
MPSGSPPSSTVAIGSVLSPARTRDHPIEVAARVALVEMAFQELAGGTIASTGTAVAFAIVMAPSIASPLLWGWLALMMVVSGYRLWLATAFKRARPQPEECPRWALRFIGATTATGLGWGLSAWIFPTLVDGGPRGVVHVLMLAGLTTGSARLLLPLRKGSLAYLLAMMGPVALRFFAEADLVGAALGACTLLFIVYMAYAMLRNHRTFSDALVMRFEREALAAELTAENVRREAREAELREARERAEFASRAKGEFLATISHEIRTPMNGVLGMLRVMRDTPLTPEQRGYVKTAADSAESLLLLLNDVLDFSKIEAGRLELERAPFSPGNTVRAVADQMLARARDKGLQFNVRLAEDLPGAIVGDATRLRQILVNLLGNAIKFTDRGRIELAVKVDRSSDRSLLQFSVTDTGIGIDSAVLDRLFQPFSQADTSMSRRYGGTGLGLAISLRIAQAMCGTIDVQSTLGRGSTFKVTLPYELPEIDGSAPLRSPAQFVTPSLRGRVLVVEDDAVNQQVIDLFLKKMNLSPAFATNGETAITTATTQPFDVVLMDCQLPGIDGLETTRRIRQRLGPSVPKIIALTANANTHVRDACLAAGMNDFLSKPVRFELLAEVLQRNLPSGIDSGATVPKTPAQK